MDTGPIIHTELFTSTELLSQPWLPDLTRMINASYMVSHTNKIKYLENKVRLRTDSELSEELGADGFTAVAFFSGETEEKVQVIGTASMKPWKDDGLWNPLDHDDTKHDPMTEKVNSEMEQILQHYACPGDYELAVVALPPDPRFRGKGIAGRLVKACEEEILRRRRVEANGERPVRIMIRVSKENAGDYWLKQGFKTVGSRKCPKGFWDSLEEFTMWAMIRELHPQ
jgi:GNAT superfamily N-acetyltransferase